MKSERRHELQQNQLADWMASSITTVRPYTNAILGIGLALLIVIVAAVLWHQRTGAEESRSWEDFYRAMGKNSFTELDTVVDTYPGSDAARWATVISGDLHLDQGCQELFSDRARANQELTKAVECYQDVLEQNASSTLRERAIYGLARAREARGELEKASGDYQQLVDNWPDGPYAKVAQGRLDDLKRPSIKEFYDRFAKFDPKPALSNEPGIPGQRPVFETDLPPVDDASLPGLDPMKLEQTAPAKTEPTESKPADVAKPEAAKPEAAKPEAAKPVDPPKTDAAPKADAPKVDATKEEPKK
jgi:hypothetical protein